MTEYDETALDSFLSGGKPPDAEKSSVDDNELDAFLDGKPIEKQAPAPRTQDEKLWTESVGDYGAGFNDAILNTLDIPNDMFNWAAEKLGVNVKIPSTRDLGPELRIGYKEGEEPDSGAYQAGEYTAMGLEFLAPILQAGKIKTGFELSDALNKSKAATIATGAAQKVASPFAKAPKSAFTGEIASSVGAGVLAHEGGERYGILGEQYGGLVGGLAPQATVLALSKMPVGSFAASMHNKFMRSVFPFTKPGSKMRGGQILRSLSETDDIIGDINRNKGNILKGAKITPARMSDDPDLMALEKVLVNEDPEIAREFRLLDERNNKVAREALNEMSPDEGVSEARLFLSGKYAKLSNRLNAYLDIKTQKAQEAIQGLHPKTQRVEANKLIREAIDTALDAARKDEDSIWRAVPVTEEAEVSPVRATLMGILDERYKSEDPSEIPSFIYEFLGKHDKKGIFRPGKYADIESAGELHAFRKRLLKEIRKEKKMEATDWNKVRIMGDLQEAALDSLENSGASTEIKDAIAFSRQLNKRFKGGVMSTILGSDIHGGKLSSSLTMESVGPGARGAEDIKRILAAAPESKDSVEQVLKMEMLYKLVNQKTQRLNMPAAKKYMINNEETLGMFPEMKKQMENAISLEEQAQWYSGVVKSRMTKAKRSAAYKISTASNKRVVTTILESDNPEKIMSRELRRLNNKGVNGLKSDIIDTIYSKSKSSNIADDGFHMLSGDKMYSYWTENKKMLGMPFNETEKRRIDTIIHTLRLSEGRKDLPIERAQNALKETGGIMEYAVRILAARSVAHSGIGGGSAGASLQAAQMASSRAKKLMGHLDIGRAKKLLSDAIFDEDLYKAIATDATKFTPESKEWRVIQGWMIANTIETMEESKD